MCQVLFGLPVTASFFAYRLFLGQKLAESFRAQQVNLLGAKCQEPSQSGSQTYSKHPETHPVSLRLLRLRIWFDHICSTFQAFETLKPYSSNTVGLLHCLAFESCTSRSMPESRSLAFTKLPHSATLTCFNRIAKQQKIEPLRISLARKSMEKLSSLWVWNESGFIEPQAIAFCQAKRMRLALKSFENKLRWCKWEITQLDQTRGENSTCRARLSEVYIPWPGTASWVGLFSSTSICSARIDLANRGKMGGKQFRRERPSLPCKKGRKKTTQPTPSTFYSIGPESYSLLGIRVSKKNGKDWEQALVRVECPLFRRVIAIVSTPMCFQTGHQIATSTVPSDAAEETSFPPLPLLLFLPTSSAKFDGDSSIPLRNLSSFLMCLSCILRSGGRSLPFGNPWGTSLTSQELCGSSFSLLVRGEISMCFVADKRSMPCWPASPAAVIFGLNAGAGLWAFAGLLEEHPMGKTEAADGLLATVPSPAHLILKACFDPNLPRAALHYHYTQTPAGNILFNSTKLDSAPRILVTQEIPKETAMPIAPQSDCGR